MKGKEGNAGNSTNANNAGACHLVTLLNPNEVDDLSDSCQLAGKKPMTLQEKKKKMAVIVSDWQASGLSQVEYARIHDFKLNTFRYWISLINWYSSIIEKPGAGRARTTC